MYELDDKAHFKLPLFAAAFAAFVINVGGGGGWIQAV